MKRPGPYVPLSAYYADDEKIMEAGEDAELLYIRMLAYAARTPRTEGWVSEAVVLSRLGILPRPGAPESDANTRAERLAKVGLIVREGTGWRLSAWLRWNRSSEQITRERTQDRNRKSRANTGKRTGNAPDAGTDSEGQKQIQIQKQRQTSPPRSPERPIPEDWKPNANHQEYAAEKRLDLSSEAFRFRNHALANDRRQRDWDAAFRVWLSKAIDFAPKGRTASLPDGATQGWWNT